MVKTQPAGRRNKAAGSGASTDRRPPLRAVSNAGVGRARTRPPIGLPHPSRTTQTKSWRDILEPEAVTGTIEDVPVPPREAAVKLKYSAAAKVAFTCALSAALLQRTKATIGPGQHVPSKQTRSITQLALKHLGRFKEGRWILAQPDGRKRASDAMWYYFDAVLAGHTEDQRALNSGGAEADVDPSQLISLIATGAFRSEEHMAADPAVERTCRQQGCSFQTLLKRAKEMEPSIACALQVETDKAYLTPEVRSDRVAYCKKMKERWRNAPPGGIPLHQCIVYIDQKVLYLHPDGNIEVWGLCDPAAREAYQGLYDGPLPMSLLLNLRKGNPKQSWRIEYYAAVTYHYGPLFIKIMSGTRPLCEGQEEYMIRDQKGVCIRVARAPTAEEIQDFIVDCSKEIERLKRTGRIPKSMTPVWSLDRTSIHTSACSWEGRADKPAGDYETAMPPTYSPDLHKVIEHVHGTVTLAFRKWMLSLKTSGPSKIDGWAKQIKSIFKNSITTAGIQRDINSLLDTYDEVIRLEGGWPARKFR